MIYSAIPLAAVGGVLLLSLRGLPFSISAGVGFIALFGIAVLNGIVLIEHLKSLKDQGMDDVNERILRGTKERLRPVILTAAAAALGFLPMAISTNAGAEVQRPLATVVIGGLITATVLTMIVLPVLYAIFDTRKFKIKKRKKGVSSTLVLLLLIIPAISFSQQKSITLNDAISLAVKNNKQLNIKNLEHKKSSKLVNSAFDIAKTKVYYEKDRTNLGVDGKPFETFGVDQIIEFPTIYFARKKANKITMGLKQISYELAKNDLIKNVSKAYYKIIYLHEKLNHLIYIDSLYQNFSKAAKRKYELGETNYLEMITSQSKYKQYSSQLSQLKNDITIAYQELNVLLQTDESYKISIEKLLKIPVKEVNINTHLVNQYYIQNSKLFKTKKGIETQSLLPDLHFNYFNSKDLKDNNIVNSFQAGISIPIFFGGKSSKISAAKIESDIADELTFDAKLKLKSKYLNLLEELKKNETQLKYFEENGNYLANEILKTATLGYKNGEIDFYQFIQSVETANQININYLINLNSFNQIALEINYLNL
jgi:cobalt-zinc-cadmium resistance protein CzcA